MSEIRIIGRKDRADFPMFEMFNVPVAAFTMVPAPAIVTAMPVWLKVELLVNVPLIVTVPLDVSGMLLA